MTPSSPALLVLEDVPEMREWLVTLISSRFPEWKVRGVGTAIDFHRAIERERPSLALLDEVLGPGEDLASLLQITEAHLIPVALITGMDPVHRSSTRLPPNVMRRMIKPDWEAGTGTESFLREVEAVIALTVSGRIG
jgi:DNA-binding NtrC family response regulator